MIMRVWRGFAEVSRVGKYFDHVRKDVIPVLNGIDGFMGIQMFQRSNGDGVEVMVMTQWVSMESILEFSGSDPTVAVVAELAKSILSSFDDTVIHFDVVPC